MARPRGRPSGYKKAYCEKVIEWGKEGKLPVYWCVQLGVGMSSLQRWKEVHDDFRLAYAQGMAEQHSYELDLLDDEPTATRLAIAKWKLSAYHHVSEVNKQEIKSDVKSEITLVEVSFSDRED